MMHPNNVTSKLKFVLIVKLKYSENKFANYTSCVQLVGLIAKNWLMIYNVCIRSWIKARKVYTWEQPQLKDFKSNNDLFSDFNYNS